MAKTVDELVLKMSVEGTAQVSDATTKMDGLENAHKKATDTLKASQGQIRNVAFQIQDLSVQIAGGTSAFVAFGQQIPQLLGGFGAMGAVLGAVAAVSIPLTQVGLKAIGVDMRNLKERTDDLTKSVKDYQDAQRSNLPTLQGLGTEYGSATAAAKDFFMVQESLSKQLTFSQAKASLKELTSEYRAFGARPNTTLGGIGPEKDQGPLGARLFTSFTKGVTLEEGKKIGEMLKGINTASQDKAIEQLDNVLKYLDDVAKAAEKTGNAKPLKFFEETVQPLMNINEQLIQQKKNLAEAAKQASELSTALLGIQSSYQPDINAARRDFNQVKAFRLEGEEKIAEFKKNMEEKSSKDQVDRSKEIAAFELRTNQDVADKIKDFAKGQSETYRAATLTNEQKIRQLDYESSILKMQDDQRFGLAANLKYDEDIAKINLEYNNTLKSIAEQRRKAQIDAGGQVALEKQAADVRDRANKNAEQARTKAVKDLITTQDIDNMKKAIDDQIARQEKLGESIRKTNDQMRDIGFQTSQLGMSPLEKQISDIKETARKAALEAGRSFAAAFGDTGDGMTPEKAKELADGLDKIAKQYDSITAAQIRNLQTTRTWQFGLNSAINDYIDNARNSAKTTADLFKTVTTGIEDAIVNTAKTGKDAWKQMLADMAEQMLRSSIRDLLASLMGGGAPSKGMAYAGISAIGKLLGFADGGQPPVGVPSIVGERGPELFIPNTAGTIVPNGAFGGGNVTYNINAVDAMSFKQMIARDPAFIHAVATQGGRSLPQTRR